MPTDDQAVAELHDRLVRCETGTLSDGWGEVSEWPVERIEAGDWTAGVFRRLNWPMRPSMSPLTSRFFGWRIRTWCHPLF